MVSFVDQNRLKAAFGGLRHLCLQVYVQYEQAPMPKEKFAELSAEYGFDPSRGKSIDLPRHKIGKQELTGGLLDKYGGEFQITQLIYTGPRCLPEVGEKYFAAIKGQYEDSVRLSFPDAGFPDSSGNILGYMNPEGDRFLHFGFMLQSYDPALCHPRDFGVLKPITIVEDQMITPEIEHINDMDFSQRKTFLSPRLLKL